MNKFFEGHIKIKSILSVYELMEKTKDKFWLASMKTLTNSENPSSTPLQIACCGIQIAACDSVNCSVSQMILWRVTVLLFKISGGLLTVGFFK